MNELQRSIDFRHELHRHPALSGEEAETAARIKKFAAGFHPTELIEQVGGHGLAVLYTFNDPGPVIMIRCELDALPIKEENDFPHRSAYAGISHQCGHDGHMVIVAGLMPWIESQNFSKGKIILLFQPAEETGTGALAVLNDPAFAALAPDYVFALHNLPGEPLHSVIVVPRQFSATVKSMALTFKGRIAHASEPEKGVNPALAMAELTYSLAALTHADETDPEFVLLTPVYSQLGTKAYGIAAGAGELHYTIRCWSAEKMERLEQQIREMVTDTCQRNGLTYTDSWFDHFPACINNDVCNKLISRAALANGFILKERATPFRFGEDFGWFSQQYNGAMFGIGAGESCPPLHHPDYDFPDEIIETGIKMFARIIHQLLWTGREDRP